MKIGILWLVALTTTVVYLWFRKNKPHQADEYFRNKLSEPMLVESRKLVVKAWSIRHRHPELTGPELVQYVYWGILP